MRGLVLVLTLMLSACASKPCVRTADGPWCAAALPTEPPFREQEQSLIMAREGVRQQAIAMVLWTPEFVEQTLLTPFGESLYRLRFQGETLEFERGALPFAFAPEYALLDMQLMIWPVALLRTTLPNGWRLESDASDGRMLFDDQQLVAEVRVGADGQRHLIHHQRRYELWVTPLATLP